MSSNETEDIRCERCGGLLFGGRCPAPGCGGWRRYEAQNRRARYQRAKELELDYTQQGGR